MQKLNCLRCDIPMEYVTRESFQKGECGAWVGNLNFSFRGGYEMEVYRCPKCGKLEFFMPGVEEREPEPDMEIDDLPPEGMQDIVGVNMHGVPKSNAPTAASITISIIPNASTAILTITQNKEKEQPRLFLFSMLSAFAIVLSEKVCYN